MENGTWEGGRAGAWAGEGGLEVQCEQSRACAGGVAGQSLDGGWLQGLDRGRIRHNCFTALWLAAGDGIDGSMILFT
ncbi:hypothetical protein TgHK011_003029 [Trichoderma gracile]|nr:hypothetical protein TgHK011_003029 [Trichoderma gracile]